MPYPVPPPPPPLVQISSSESAVAAPLPTAPIAFSPERPPQAALEPTATEAAPLGGTIERSTRSPLRTIAQPAIDALQEAQLPNLSPDPAPESVPLPAPIEADPAAVEPSPADLPRETIEIAPTEENPSGQTIEITPVPPEGQPESQPEGQPDAAPDPTNPAAPPDPSVPVAPAADPTTDPSGTGSIIELDADYQEYDNNRQVFTGIGNVEMRFRGAILNADRVQVNLVNRIAVGEGNVRLERGDQVLRGDRFTYNFVQTVGTVLAARGEVFIPNAGRDFSAAPNGEPIDPNAVPNAGGAPAAVPVFGTGGGFTFGVGNGGPALGGAVNRIRFEAERLDFTAEGWQATNVRLTNDPFSPPELELRSPTVTFTRLSPTRSEIRARNPRIVFDQGFSLPLLRNRIILDSRQREATPIQLGFDQRDRGGLFVEGIFEPIATPNLQLQIRPQIFLQQAILGSPDQDVIGVDNRSSLFDNLGLVAQLDARLSPTTTVEANLAIVSPLTSDNREDNIRASVRARQFIGNHRLSLEYSFRDRLFNGSLGYQTVYSSLGFIFTSPQFTLGDTGINYSYQFGTQLVTADTDRADLLEPIRDNNRITLGRIQGVLAANRFVLLWQGLPLPATPTEGLRYTPNPVVPFVGLVPSARLISNFYTNGESQTTLTGSLGIVGQFGHYSRPFLDYTGFNLSYSQRFGDGESPFLFDRDVDERVLSFGIRQQIYGPFLFGIQAAINLDRGDGFDTDYSLEYNRRTFSVILRVNPERELGSIGLRINDFNFGTDTAPFSGRGNDVTGGLQQPNN